MELPDELGLVEWKGEGGSPGLRPALPIIVRTSPARPAMTMRLAGAVLALLCIGAIGRLWLDFSFGTLLIGAGCILVFGMLGKLWFSERAYRSSEHERDEHFIREREFASARRRERGD